MQSLLLLLRHFPHKFSSTVYFIGSYIDLQPNDLYSTVQIQTYHAVQEQKGNTLQKCC